MRRRSFVLGSCAVLSTFAGCLNGGGSAETEEDEHTSLYNNTKSSPTQTLTTTPIQDYSLVLNAQIDRQQTSENPAQINVKLRNTGKDKVDVGFGPTLLYTSGVVNVEGPAELVLDPETYIGPWADPVQDDNDCWRFRNDGERLVQDSLGFRKIQPGGVLSESYDVYTYGMEGTCFPAGTYRFHDQSFVNNESQPIVLALTVDIDENQQLSVNSEKTRVMSQV